MHEPKNIKLLCFVGMTGSGKSTAVNYVKEKGVPQVYFGGILYDAMREAGIEITWESQQKLREEIRAKEGKDFIINRALKQVDALISAGQKRILLDGLYSWTEYKILKHKFPGEATLIALVPPKKVRHKRLTSRPDHPMTEDEANARDWSEVENLEKGGPLALADFFIVNSGPESDTHTQIDQILTEINFFD